MSTTEHAVQYENGAAKCPPRRAHNGLYTSSLPSLSTDERLAVSRAFDLAEATLLSTDAFLEDWQRRIDPYRQLRVNEARDRCEPASRQLGTLLAHRYPRSLPEQLTHDPLTAHAAPPLPSRVLRRAVCWAAPSTSAPRATTASRRGRRPASTATAVSSSTARTTGGVTRSCLCARAGSRKIHAPASSSYHLLPSPSCASRHLPVDYLSGVCSGNEPSELQQKRG